MQQKTTLSDLKNSLAAIMIDLGKGTDDVISHTDAISALKAKHAKAITLLTPQLIDIAFGRMANEVGRRKTRAGKSNTGVDLFGVYHGVPAMMSISNGLKKDFRKASLKEGKAWLERHSGSLDLNPDRNKGVRFLIQDLEKYAVTGDESFEELAELKAKAATG